MNNILKTIDEYIDAKGDDNNIHYIIIQFFIYP